MNPLPILTRDPLQTLKVEAIGYGAKDTGEMGGGAAAAVLTAAGPELLPALKSRLSSSPRRVGDVVVTESFRMRPMGIQWVLHIISIIKNTPQGAYCPHPERLRDGVAAALQEAMRLGVQSVALSALGTGEGRVDPRDAARFMLQGVTLFRQGQAAAFPQIIFALPSFRDFEAFQSVLCT